MKLNDIKAHKNTSYLDIIDEGVTDMPEGSDSVQQLEILMSKLEACSRALGIANKLPSPEDKKKYRSRVMGFMNQLRPMFNRVAKALEKEIESGK